MAAALLTSKLYAVTMHSIYVGLPQTPLQGSTWGTAQGAQCSDFRQV